MSKKELKGLATPEQVAEWKKKHGDVFQVIADDSICYLRKPDRKTMTYVATLGNSPIRANEALLDNCWLGGDESIKTNDEKFFGVSSKLSDLIQIKEAEITKL